jgi:hypothetical protein
MLDIKPDFSQISPEMCIFNIQPYYDILNLNIESVKIIFDILTINGKLNEADIAISITFANNIEIIFATSSNLWTTGYSYQKLCATHKFYSFHDRLSYWINQENKWTENRYEVFDCKASLPFGKLINDTIIDIGFLNIGNVLNPYGIVLYFNKNLPLYSFSGSFGNQITFENFNSLINPLKIYSFLGEMNIISIKN